MYKPLYDSKGLFNDVSVLTVRKFCQLTQGVDYDGNDISFDPNNKNAKIVLSSHGGHVIFSEATGTYCVDMPVYTMKNGYLVRDKILVPIDMTLDDILNRATVCYIGTSIENDEIHYDLLVHVCNK